MLQLILACSSIVHSRTRENSSSYSIIGSRNMIQILNIIELKTLPLWISILMLDLLFLLIFKNLNCSQFNQKPRNLINFVRNQWENFHRLVGSQQGYPKNKIKKKIKSVHSEYRNLAIGMNTVRTFVSRIWGSSIDFHLRCEP